MHSKAAHVVLVLVVVPCALVSERFYVAVLLPPLAFWVAGVTEAMLGSASVGEACREVGNVTGRWLLGFVGFFVFSVLPDPHALNHL
jgi:hypothetical protein